MKYVWLGIDSTESSVRESFIFRNQLYIYLYMDFVMRLFCLAIICTNCPVALLFLSFSLISPLIPSIFCLIVKTSFLMALKRSSMSRMKTVKMRIPWPEVRTMSRNIMILKMPVGGRESDTRVQYGKVISRLIVILRMIIYLSLYLLSLHRPWRCQGENACKLEGFRCYHPFLGSLLFYFSSVFRLFLTWILPLHYMMLDWENSWKEI